MTLELLCVHLWNTYHSLESTELALNFWLAQILLLNLNTQTQDSFVCSTGTGFRCCPLAVYITVDTRHSSVDFTLCTLGSLWHLSGFHMTLPFFRFLPQSRYLVTGIAPVRTHTHTHKHVHLHNISMYLSSTFRLHMILSEPHFLLCLCAYSLLSSVLFFLLIGILAV